MQQPHRRFHQPFNALAVNRAHREDVGKPNFGEFRDAGLGPLGVHLIDGDQNRFAAAAQPRGSLAVQRHDALLDVHDEDDDVGRFDGELDLLERRLDDDVDLPSHGATSRCRQYPPV